MTTFGLGTICPAGTSDVATAAAPTTARRPITQGPTTLARKAIHAPFCTYSGSVDDAGQVSCADCESTTSLPMMIGAALLSRTSSPIQQFAPICRFQGALIRTRCRIRTPVSMVAPKCRSTATRSEVGTNAKPMIVEASAQLSDMR